MQRSTFGASLNNSCFNTAYLENASHFLVCVALYKLREPHYAMQAGFMLFSKFPLSAYRNYLSSAATTPGSALPSKNSRDAPPPVEIWLILSAKPN